MFIFFEYTAIVALIALVATLLFAVSAALLMVEEGLAAALRVLRRIANTMNTTATRHCPTSTLPGRHLTSTTRAFN